MKKHFSRSIALALAAILVLSACGSMSDSPPSSSAPSDTGGTVATSEQSSLPLPESSSAVTPTPTPEPAPATTTIEIEDVKGNKHTITYADLYYRFYLKAHAGAVLANSWAHASEIEGHYLVNFFTDQSNWIQSSYEAAGIYIPQEIVEDYLKMYFDIESEQVRQAKLSYRPELKAYELPMYSLESPSAITNATSEGNLLTIYYETYNDKQDDLPVLRKGHVTIEIEWYPVRWKYISNKITYFSDPYGEIN